MPRGQYDRSRLKNPLQDPLKAEDNPFEEDDLRAGEDILRRRPRASELNAQFAEARDPLANLTPEQKRALAIKLLGETDPDLHDAVKLAEQEKETQVKIDNSLRDEATKQRNEPHFWIEINRMGPDDSEPEVFVGAAGVSYNIQKDVMVPVPQSVLDVLENAVVISHVPIVDENLGVKYAKKVRFKRRPYSRIGPASKEEVANWHAEQDNKRQIAEGITIGQEVARATLVQEAILNQEEPFVPAYLKESRP